MDQVESRAIRARYLLIVARDELALYCSGISPMTRDVCGLLDRRVGERRKPAETHDPERRIGEPRRASGITDKLRSLGWAIVRREQRGAFDDRSSLCRTR